MSLKLKPLRDQVIVVTGATSGHGLCTAQMAAAAGARVMLAARDEEALRSAVDEISAKGGTAAYAVTDVGKEADVERLAEQTIERFGGFDTWVNNAGVGIYARIFEMPTGDHRQLFETNYWGVVYGSIAAARHLKNKPDGGAIINVGSVNGDMSGPVLSAYNASKHAVKGFTDALRIELLEEKAPISVTLVKPSAIGTPFPEHGRNLTGHRASLPAPLYTPDLVATAILGSAQHARRSITVGGAGKFQVLGATILPWLFDRLAVAMADKLVKPDQSVGRVEGNLYAPQGNDGHTEGRQTGRGFSTFTTVRRHPKTAIGTAILLGAVGGWATLRQRRQANA